MPRRSNGTDTSAAVSIELNVADRNEPGILKIEVHANYKMEDITVNSILLCNTLSFLI